MTTKDAVAVKLLRRLAGPHEQSKTRPRHLVPNSRLFPHIDTNSVRPADGRLNVQTGQFIATTEIHDVFVHPLTRFSGIAIAKRLQDFLMREDKTLSGVEPGEHISGMRDKKAGLWADGRVAARGCPKRSQ